MGVGGSDGIPRDPRESINLGGGRELSSYPFVASTPKLRELINLDEGTPSLPFRCIHPKTLSRESMRIGKEPSALDYVFK